MVTGYGTIEAAVEAIKQGAFDYLTKPIIDDDLQLAVARALKQQMLIAENRQLRRAAGRPVQLRQHRRARLQDAQGLRPDRGRGRQPHDRADDRRERHRQEPDRPRHPRPQRPTEQAVRGGLLRRPAGDAAGERAVRARQGGLHRRPGRQGRASSSGRRRDDLPGRDLHGLAGAPGQAAARAPGAAVRAGRLQRATQTVDVRVHPGQQPRPDRRGAGRAVPPGPVLPHQRGEHRPAAAARADGRHPAAGAALPEEVRGASPARPSPASPRRACG